MLYQTIGFHKALSVLDFNYKESLQILHDTILVSESKILSSKIKLETVMDAKVLMNIGLIAYDQSDFSKAALILKKCEKVIARSAYLYETYLLNLSMTFHAMKEYKQSLEVAEKGLQSSLQSGNRDCIDRFLYRVGVAELILGSRTEALSKFHSIKHLKRINFHSDANDWLIGNLKTYYDITLE